MPDDKQPGGRPTKLTKEVQSQITTAIGAGNYMETAAAFAGIHKDTLYEWLKRGAAEKARVAVSARRSIRQEEQIYTDFSDAVKKALAQGELHDVLIIQKAADGYDVIKHRQVLDKNGDAHDLTDQHHEFDWRAAAWRLERKFPNRWGRHDRHEVTGPDGGPIQHEVTIADLLADDDDTN